MIRGCNFLLRLFAAVVLDTLSFWDDFRPFEENYFGYLTGTRLFVLSLLSYLLFY